MLKRSPRGPSYFAEAPLYPPILLTSSQHLHHLLHLPSFPSFLIFSPSYLPSSPLRSPLPTPALQKGEILVQVECWLSRPKYYQKNNAFRVQSHMMRLTRTSLCSPSSLGARLPLVLSNSTNHFPQPLLPLSHNPFLHHSIAYIL